MLLLFPAFPAKDSGTLLYPGILSETQGSGVFFWGLPEAGTRCPPPQRVKSPDPPSLL